MEAKELKGLLPVYISEFIDKEQTTADLCVGQFVEKRHILTFDKPWEGDHCVYHNFFKDDDIYKMYYLAHSSATPFTEIRVCYAYSKDGRTWIKPELGLREFNGNKQNNIILDKSDKKEGDFFDNFFVFKDANPKCKPNQKYKALAYTSPYKIACFFSADGINFNAGPRLEIIGRFDTLNTCFFDTNINKYVAYIRDFHNIPENGDLNLGIRDIRRTESEDFINWTVPELLNFGKAAKDFPLYTNNVMPHPENNEIFIGFPSRYIERAEWTDNYDKLTGREARLERMKEFKRYGLAVTDCLFMASADGKNWDRFDQALITPGVENGNNWVYGDCYPAYGFIEDENTYSILLRNNQWSNEPAQMHEYSIRKDGFAFYSAPFADREVVFKKAFYKGGKIFMNFSTSAAGSIIFTIEDDCGNKDSTCEMFGDSICREVSFPQKVLEKYKHKIISIKIKLIDAKLYSLKFE